MLEDHSPMEAVQKLVRKSENITSAKLQIHILVSDHDPRTF